MISFWRVETKRKRDKCGIGGKKNVLGISYILAFLVRVTCFFFLIIIYNFVIFP